MGETDFITRMEFETRHSELRTEMIGLRASDDSLRRDVMGRFDVFASKMEALSEGTNAKIEGLETKIEESRAGGWKLTAMSLINLGIGIAVGWAAHIITIPK